MITENTEPKPMRLARFKNLDGGYSSICESMFETISGYIRVSEYVEVTFPPLNDAAVVTKHIEALDRAAEAITARYEEKMGEIKRQKAELAALTYQPEVA